MSKAIVFTPRGLAMSSVILVTLMSAALAADAVPTPAELEKAVVESRMKVRSGTFDFTIHSGDRLFARVHVAFDEKGRKRFDFAQFEQKPSASGDIVQYDTRKFLAGEIVSSWYKHVQPDEVYFGGEIERDTGERPNFLDPRVMGLSSGHFESMLVAKVDALVQNLPRKSAMVSADTVDGIRVWRLDITLQNGVKTKFYVAPEKGNCILKSEVLAPSGHRMTTRNDFKEYKPGIWFPSQLECTNVGKAGGSYVETIKFESVKLNVADDREFSLEGLEIPVGTVLSDRTHGEDTERRVWDGRQLVPETR